MHMGTETKKEEEEKKKQKKKKKRGGGGDKMKIQKRCEQYILIVSDSKPGKVAHKENR